MPLSDRNRQAVPKTSGSLRFVVYEDGRPGRKPTVTTGAGTRLRRVLGR